MSSKPLFKIKSLCAAILLATTVPVLQAGELDLGSEVSIIGDLGLSFAKVTYINDAGERAVYRNISIKLNADLTWSILTDPANANGDGVFTLTDTSELKKFADDIVQMKNVQFRNKSYTARIKINIDGSWEPVMAEYSTPQDIPIPEGFSFGMTNDVAVNVTVMGADGKPMVNTAVIIAEASQADVDLATGESMPYIVNPNNDIEVASGKTDTNGQFSVTVNIPSRIDQLRIIASNIGVPNSTVNAPIINGEINFVIDGSADDSAYYNPGITEETDATRRSIDELPLSAWTYLLGVDADGNQILGDFDDEIFDWNGIHRNGYDTNPPVIPQSLYNIVSQQLTERRVFTDELASADGASLLLVQDGEVKVSFLDEGAGYKNVFGYFTYPEGETPTARSEITPVIVFPNASYSSSGGSGLRDGGSAQGLRPGDTINLGKFSANTRIGFFLFGNGWREQSKTPDDAWVFHTVPGLNSETAPTEGQADLRQHTVLLDAGETGIIMGMEDIHREDSSCDHDFNDVVFLVNTDPPEAIDRTDVPPVVIPPDSDGDGVDDPTDSHPDDPERASIKRTRGILAYEDLWPSEGDYDLNDLIVQYRTVETLHANGDIKDINTFYLVKARGASLDNSFAVSFDGITADTAYTATIGRRTRGRDTEVITAEAGQTNLVFNIMADVNADTVIEEQEVDGKACEFYNTEAGCFTQRRIIPYYLNVTFDTPQAREVLNHAPYNPFLYRMDNRGLEIHLPDMAPTDLVDASLFGSADDASDPSTNSYYKTSKGLPWALNIPTSNWSYPLETLSVTDMYLNFFTWVQSGGTEKKGWYRNPSDRSMLYKKPAS